MASYSTQKDLNW